MTHFSLQSLIIWGTIVVSLILVALRIRRSWAVPVPLVALQVTTVHHEFLFGYSPTIRFDTTVSFYLMSARPLFTIDRLPRVEAVRNATTVSHDDGWRNSIEHGINDTGRSFVVLFRHRARPACDPG